MAAPFYAPLLLRYCAVYHGVSAFNPMNIPLSVRIRSFFTRDKHAFWWNHFTDDEKQLRRMDAWELATVIHEENIRQTAPEKRIVAEHMLNVRLAKIQTRATYISIVAGLVGAVGGAFLTTAFQKPDSQTKCTCECSHSAPIQQNMSGPVPDTVPPVVKTGVPKGLRIQNDSQASAKAKP